MIDPYQGWITESRRVWASHPSPGPLHLHCAGLANYRFPDNLIRITPSLQGSCLASPYPPFSCLLPCRRQRGLQFTKTEYLCRKITYPHAWRFWFWKNMPSAPDALYQRSGSLVIMLYFIPYTTSLENLDPLSSRSRSVSVSWTNEWMCLRTTCNEDRRCQTPFAAVVRCVGHAQWSCRKLWRRGNGMCICRGR